MFHTSLVPPNPLFPQDWNFKHCEFTVRWTIPEHDLHKG